ncbi:TPA: putative 3',5'-cyclic phosphodiesterase pde-3 [Trebouxia sp. C0006]
MHTMIFTAQGTLLHANKAALESLCQHSISGMSAGVEGNRVVTMKVLFDQGLYSGGEDECQAAYEEAVDAIFNLKVDCHRHVQSYLSRKDGKIKWAAFEMWPMQDPIEVCPAVLVKRYDITQQKELELQLAQQQVGLQRQNQLLEEASVSMQQEQDRLQHQASSLADQLQAVLQEKRHWRRLSFDAETPVDKTLNYLQSVICGQAQSSDTALELFNLLSSSDTKLRQPVGLEMQLMQDMRMDSDVSRSMLQLLQGGGTRCETPSSEVSAPLVLTVSNPSAVQYGPVAQPNSMPIQSSIDQAASFLPVPVTPALERMLQDAENNWQFDVFAFSEAAPRNTLCLLTCHFFKRSGLIDDFGLDPEKLCRYLQRIEAGYSAANSYHNCTHATAVVQMTHMILRHGGAVPEGPANALYMASAYWSAAVHDFEHGGVNNDFLIKTAHPLAITYNDQSPLENHHLAAATLENLKPQHLYTPVALLRSEEFMLFRQNNTSMVLGTDMKKHFDIMSRFQTTFQRGNNSSLEPGAANGNLDLAGLKAEDRTLVHQMLLKCAGIGHLAAAPANHRRWALYLEEEFFQQVTVHLAHGASILYSVTLADLQFINQQVV